MIIYPEDAPERLGLYALVAELSRQAETPEVRQELLELKPAHHPAEIRDWLNQTSAYMRLLVSADYPREVLFREIRPLLKKAIPENAWLGEEELFKVILWLRSLKIFLSWLEQKREDYPELIALIPVLDRPYPFLDFLSRHFSPEGRLRDDASPELNRLRKAILDTGFKVRRLTERIHKAARDQGWTDAREVSIRNGRLVIPLNSDFKGRIEGFVQDISQSGQTVFIEPAEALPLNNELSVLQLKERQEIIRILTSLTTELRMRLGDMEAWAAWLRKMENLQARARLSLKLKAAIPRLDSSGEVLRIVQGRNPLLVLQIQDKVIPLDLELNRTERILLISGPNAGGKSVALKTVGILQWMVQCGLPVPADGASEFPVLAALFTVVGDGQSIENDLSTYTAHLAHMRHLLDRAHDSSLFLIDEFGSGTDPKSGGPIATALLESLVNKGAYGVVTTHYSDLKQLARRNPVVRNAAMHFDLSAFKPTYRLETGHAGSSYAFEIARKAGIPEAVLKRGKQLMGKAPAETEEMLATINREKAEIQALKEEMLREKAEWTRRQEKVGQDEQEAKIRAKKIIAEARERSKEMVAEASRKIGEMVTTVREQQIEKKVAKSIQKELLNLVPEIESGEPEAVVLESPLEVVMGKSPEPGDSVRWIATGAQGRVLEILNDRYIVAFGDIRTTLKKEELLVLREKGSAPAEKGIITGEYAAPASRMNVTTILDIRGQRVEPARLILQKFLDDALVSGLPYIHIIHGKGNGTLREMTRELLKHTPGIRKIEEPPQEQGGAGATYAWFQ